ncbi:MAG: YafY family transcriptional regulator [Lachnospiraceae bacterium]|nr:YafY family transcriptional regulator [Lachnospiraceae bacterium]
MLNRRLGIVYLLMKKKTVTAAELAERYEVSVRTIYRDIEALSMIGVPVYAQKGRNGGISLTEQFVLDRMLVTEEEQKQILAALKSLDEVGARTEQDTFHKLGDFFKVQPPNWIAVDFSDWSGKRQELFEGVRRAILETKVICFDYYGQNGTMTHRTVEPVQLLFKEYTWYLRAFCRSRNAMRLFKLLRMKRMELLPETFTPRPEVYTEDVNSCGEPKDDKSVTTASDNDVILKEKAIEIHIAKSEAYRIYDRFEEDEITVLEDGSFLIKIDWIQDDWLWGMILSFGSAAEVTAPKEAREEMQRRIRKMAEVYEAL